MGGGSDNNRNRGDKQGGASGYKGRNNSYNKNANDFQKSRDRNSGNKQEARDNRDRETARQYKKKGKHFTSKDSQEKLEEYNVRERAKKEAERLAAKQKEDADKLAEERRQQKASDNNIAPVTKADEKKEDSTKGYEGTGAGDVVFGEGGQSNGKRKLKRAKVKDADQRTATSGLKV